MDSPEAAKTTTSTATAAASLSGSPPVQESPFSSYLSKLSPIEPVKGTHVAQGFLGLNSPPLVFSSPHINPLREASYLKRSHCPKKSSAEGAEVSSKKSSNALNDVGKSVIQLQNKPITDAPNSSDIKNVVQAQPSSSSDCVDEYLADTVEVDSVYTTYSVKSFADQKDVPQSSLNELTGCKQITSEYHDKNDIGTKPPLTLSVQAKENFEQNSNHDVNHAKIEAEQRGYDCLSKEYSNIEPDLSEDHASLQQQCKLSGLQKVGGCSEDNFHSCPQLPLGSMTFVQSFEDSGKNLGAISDGPENNPICDPEASQQRGMSRRCLQFEEAQPQITVSGKDCMSPADNVASLMSHATTAEFESFESSNVDLNGTSCTRHLVDESQPLSTMYRPCHSQIPFLSVSKPSGIGLHLNSIVTTVSVAHGAAASVTLADVSVQQMKSGSATSCHSLENIMNLSNSSNIVEKISASAEDGVNDSQALEATGCPTSESFNAMKPLNKLRQIEDLATPSNKRKVESKHADGFEESVQLSPKKKKKKSSSSGDGDGCKRCNCKKSKCLKLYCDCFAAGIYCAEPCACQGCFNRPEYEETVLETREQIETRNPLAFAPKIVQLASEISENTGEDGNLVTPSSARHKRGCNCKKSMCLKKYCECYQARVGCSTGCRCEGCKNVHGKKGEYNATEEMMSIRATETRLEGTLGDKMEMVTSKRDFVLNKLYDLHDLTPLTPSFQGSVHGKAAPKSRFLSRRYLPSPESDTIESSHAKSTRSPRNLETSNALVETSREILDIISYSQRMEHNNADKVEDFSPSCDALADMCHLTPLPNPDSIAMASSASSKARDWTDALQLHLCSGHGRLPLHGSLCWPSSPITPMIQSGATKNVQGLDSDGPVYDFVEDDTPEVLKDASTPTKPLQVSSPTRKRVSPPHSRVLGHGSSSSGALKSGRKFILKAVPSFPPLTPCIGPKSSINESAIDNDK